MKTILTTITAALIAVSTFAGNGDTEKTTHTVNTEKSTIFWTGKKVTGMHTGTLMLKDGTVTVKDGIPVEAMMTMNMTTIEVTDIQDAEMNGKLKGHLHSPDFFSTEENPEGVFKSTSFTPIEGAKDRMPNYTVKGMLTLKGITHEVEFPAFVAVRDNGIVANGKITIDRSKWDIKYGSSSFFEGLGDKVIYDDIDMNFVLSTK
ncbi:YceI family protein [Cryomorpha ignava]|uniref:YceI family protein n=1 Tax=Cryomorpha ignava TaxID=101383 RepID=A0A7K3WPM7_9FLAO|nr:YceI family protein [Cryomorpha ignava]NEN23610.1 YceI family protein [Cryomorpha ignava]